MSHHRQPWTVLALLVIAQFMVILDITIVNVALPSIGRALDVSAASLPWVVTTYVLCSGGLLLVGGRLSDLVGRRRTFRAGLLLFTAASLASGLAPSAGALIAARAVQGVGAALMTPSALAILTTTYAGAQRATALSIWGAVASAGVGVGVVAGGMLTTWLSWRWCFLVNVPVGVATAALAPRVLPVGAPTSASARGLRDLDLPGAAAVVAGLVALVYAISGAADHGWASARTLGFAAAAFVLLAAFVLIERRVARPLLAPGVWRMPTVTSGAVFMLCATGLLTGAFFLNSLYLQSVLGWSALKTGLAFLPLVGAIGLGVHVTSRAVSGVGSRALIAGGLALVGVGALLLALAPDDARYAADVLPGLLVLGLGVGLAFPAVSIAAMSEVTHDGAGSASGLMSTAHEVGAALGVAVLSSIAASSAGGFGAGYGDAFLVAAVVAGVLAALAVVAVPVVRPAPGAHVGVH
jgi:EmrB/QacA subfamily drug resistance transporter